MRDSESMKDNEQKAKAQHKKYHDRTTTTKEFNEGDMVLASPSTQEEEQVAY